MNIALILSGGTGSRLKSEVPKQYLDVSGQMIVTRCLVAFLSHQEINSVQIVAAKDWRKAILDECELLPGKDKIRGFSSPGVNRQCSILNGLRDIDMWLRALGSAPGPPTGSGIGGDERCSEDEDIVIVHDAARPMVSERLISDCIAACKEHGGAMPVLPMKDTVYLGEGLSRRLDKLSDRNTGNLMKVAGLLDRGRVFAGQAPEAFRFTEYLAANEALSDEEIMKINGSTEAAVLAGMDVVMIPGDERNFKITTEEDLRRYEAAL